MVRKRAIRYKLNFIFIYVYLQKNCFHVSSISAESNLLNRFLGKARSKPPIISMETKTISRYLIDLFETEDRNVKREIAALQITSACLAGVLCTINDNATNLLQNSTVVLTANKMQ